MQQENELRSMEWRIRKGLQQEVAALREVTALQEARAQARQNRLRWAGSLDVSVAVFIEMLHQDICASTSEVAFLFVRREQYYQNLYAEREERFTLRPQNSRSYVSARN